MLQHYTIAVSGQECTDTVTVGSLNRSNINIVPLAHTFILAGYTVPCSGTVVAWEFCYQRSGAPSVTFYPGIWRISETNDNTNYTLIQSNSVKYDPSVYGPQDPNDFGCQIFNLSDTDQFTAPAGSVVGLYSNVGSILSRSGDTDRSVTTYSFNGNQSSVQNMGRSNDVNYNISVRVHLGKNYKKNIIKIIYICAACVHVHTFTCSTHIHACMHARICTYTCIYVSAQSFY